MAPLFRCPPLCSDTLKGYPIRIRLPEEGSTRLRIRCREFMPDKLTLSHTTSTTSTTSMTIDPPRDVIIVQYCILRHALDAKPFCLWTISTRWKSCADLYQDLVFRFSTTVSLSRGRRQSQRHVSRREAAKTNRGRENSQSALVRRTHYASQRLHQSKACF
jgi:hypothetical protein